MHASAMRIAGKFLSAYHTLSAAQILEVGSMDVNGSLRRLQPVGSTWTGVDIEDGPGVDVVVPIHSPLPFPDNYFDLVLASSVFEHDTAFWVTLEEMARVVKPTGFIYISAPSNGMVHRYPLDVFRFYPDASIAFLEIVKKRKRDACLAESFVAAQDPGELWNDFVCIIGGSSEVPQPRAFISHSEVCSNIWRSGAFVNESYQSDPEDKIIIAELRQESSRLEAIEKSFSWRVTAPLRWAFSWIDNQR
jgi:SAM-dependent methyltransferase